MLLRFLFVMMVAVLGSCNSEKPADDLTMRQVGLPNGKTIHAEVLFRRDDVMRGMMFRTSLPENRGLLFIHARPGRHSYWMHNVKVPLDIIWLNKEREIVEIVPAVPPCPESDPVKCPQYGGNAESRFVLELGSGMAARHGLALGQTLDF
jgi:uncharacterized membrane protein (UPF0127 family)